MGEDSVTDEYTITDERQADDMVVGIDGREIVIDMSVCNEHVRCALDPFTAQELANKLSDMSKILTYKLLLRGDRE